MSRNRLPLMLVALLALSPACGIGMLQSARTTPPGEIDTTIGVGWVQNWMVSERSPTLQNIPLHLGMRYGVSDQLDLGGTFLLFTGGLFDGKYNFMPADDPFALSLRAGLGASYGTFMDEGMNTVKLPINVMASYLPRSDYEIYGAVGYSTFWFFGGRRPVWNDPNRRLADRRYHGDGVVTINVGMRLIGYKRRSFLVEYNFWWPVLDDPGDLFSMVPSHIFMTGLTF